MAQIDPLDERPHTPGTEQFWNESWYFDFFASDGSIGGYVRVGLYPNLGTVWYWACVVGPDRPLVTVIDHDVALPRDGRLELRANGLWADHNVEEPAQRMSLGLEAFAVSLDDPAETYRSMRGDRVGLAFDLEWETDAATFAYEVTTRYEIPCRVHGEIQVGDEPIELDGWGQRDHSWGVRDWWADGWCWFAGRFDDGERVHSVALDHGFGIGYRGRPGGELVPVTSVSAVPALGPDGIPTSASLRLDELALAVDPVAWAPVLLVSPDGRESRFPRGLVRFLDGDGRLGRGWIEFNQPPG